MKLKCIIVDDEDLARGIIELYLKDVDFIEVVASCSSAMEALNYLNTNKIDIIFLDINMPKIDGLTFIKTLKSMPKIIITTAYREFAVEGFELDVVDYLCKPFSFERFLLAINKTVTRINSEQNQQIETENSKKETIQNQEAIFIKSDKKSYRINLDEILFIEADGDYVKIITSEKSFTTYMNLKDIEKLLPQKLFPRVHRSFIVSITKIDSVEGNQIKIGKSIIPIGRNFKENFMSLLS